MMQSMWLLRTRPPAPVSAGFALAVLVDSLGIPQGFCREKQLVCFKGLGVLVRRVTTYSSDGKTVVCKTAVYFLSCARNLCE